MSIATKAESRVKRLSTRNLWKLTWRQFDRVDDLMTEGCEGGLTFGWDWPTAFVLHERWVKAYRRTRNELNRRFKESGLTAEQFCIKHNLQ